MENNYSQNEEIDVTFAEQIVYAIIRPRKYKEIINLKTKRFVGFVIVMMLVLGMATFLIPTCAVIAGFGGFEKLFTQSIPPLTYADGKLSIEEPFEIKIDTYRIIIDTDESSVSADKLDKSGIYLAVGSENARLAMVTGGSVYNYQSIELSKVLSEGFTNSDLNKLIAPLYVSIFVTFIITCFSYFAKYAVIALIFSIIVNSMNKKMELDLSYGKVFAICFYAQSFAMILSNFNLALSNPIPEFLVSIVDLFVTIHMLTTAVVSMKGEDSKTDMFDR